MKITRVALLFLTMAVLAGCAPAPVAPPAAAAAPPPPVVPLPPPPSTPPAPAPLPPDPPLSRKLTLSGRDALQSGKEDQARAELERAVALDPNNKQAPQLLRQITDDPAAVLGRESFAYTVKPKESLSIIAQRFLHNQDSFYILARYNNIAVPRQLASGQVIRVPGKVPPPQPPGASPSPPPSVIAEAPVSAAPPTPPSPPPPSPGLGAWRDGQAAEKSGDLDRALAQYTTAASLDQPQAGAKVADVRKRLVARSVASAKSAFARQDLDGAIRNWDRVLELDPGNRDARLEGDRARTLRDNLAKISDKK